MSQHGHLCITVVGVVLQYLLIDVQRLLLLSVHIERIGIQTTIVVVMRVLVGQFLHLADSRLLVTFLCKEAALGKRQALRLTLQGLQAVQRTNRIVVIMLLLIQLYQHAQHLVALPAFVVQAFQHLDSISILALGDVDIGQCLQVRGVVRLQVDGLFHQGQHLVLLLQCPIVLSQIVISLRAGGVDVYTMAQQVESRIAVAFLALHYGFEKEIIVALVHILCRTNEK